MKVLVSVFGNLYTDQRVEKVCRTLHGAGYQVELIGNDWGGTGDMRRPYPFSRIALKAKSLKFAYPEHNYKLYKALLLKADRNTVLLANDLDSLLPNFLVAKRLNIPLVWDSHEIFTEMPSLNGRFTQNVWRMLEKALIGEIKVMITASESYARWFAKTYGIKKPVVVQNFPVYTGFEEVLRYNSPKIILYQGWLNYSRGIDKAIRAMKYINGAELQIAGDGPMRKSLEALSKDLGLEHCIKFLGKISPEALKKITQTADVGLSIEENNGLSYYYSLPNKVSDYISAGVPVVVSDFPEMKRIVKEFQVGETISSHKPEHLAEKISLVLKNGRCHYREKLKFAAEELCWQREQPKILEVFRNVERDFLHQNLKC